MTQLTLNDVSHLAALSGLNLTDDETGSLLGDLNRIIEYVSSLNELDTDGVEPTYQVSPLQNVGQADQVDMGEVSRDQLLALAPAQRDFQIEVPKVL